jgi:hypothetical protein
MKGPSSTASSKPSRCSRPLSNCYGRRRGVEVAVKVSKAADEVFEAAVEVSRPPSKC